MTDWIPATRFLDAARRAAARTGLAALLPELLVRYGFPGLMIRLGLLDGESLTPGLLAAQKLYDALLVEQADAVSGVLRAAGVPHCFVKGIALAGAVYQPGDRLQGDIDLHVPPAARNATLAALATLGYAPTADDDQAGPGPLRSAVALERVDGGFGSATIEVHWAVDPLDRLLPRGDRPLPAIVWDMLDTTGPRTVPAAAHHAALLAHHLVHTDLLHVRGLLDLAMVLPEVRNDAVATYRTTCAALGIERFGLAVARLIARDLGAPLTPRLTDAPASRAAPLRRLTLERWLTLVAQTDPGDDARITVARIRRRLGLLDRPAVVPLAEDLVWPPAAFLEWRWGRPLWRARLHHYGQLARKATAALI